MTHKLLINSYYPGVNFNNFPDLTERINSYYDRIYDTTVPFEITPRYIYEMGLKIGFRDIFYYIDQLYNNNPKTIIDVGCGECIWKTWFPNIIGFDPNTNEFTAQDFIDFFDNDFSVGHTNEYDSGMALNSLHFIDWKDIATQINLAMNIVNDRFLFTFNFASMNNLPTNDMFKNIVDFRKILDESNYSLVMFDTPILRKTEKLKIENWSHINGTVRFILEHKK
jgi:hypothetical protein